MPGGPSLTDAERRGRVTFREVGALYKLPPVRQVMPSC